MSSLRNAAGIAIKKINKAKVMTLNSSGTKDELLRLMGEATFVLSIALAFSEKQKGAVLGALIEAENALSDYVETIEKTGATLNYGNHVLGLLRAAIAAEFFGEKLARKALPALVQGGEALKNFIDQAAKMSSQTISDLDAAGDRIQELSNRLKVMSGNAIGAYFNLARLAGIASTKDWAKRIFFAGPQGAIQEIAAMLGEASVEDDALRRGENRPQSKGSSRALSIREDADKLNEALRKLSDADAKRFMQRLSDSQKLVALEHQRESLIEIITRKEDASVANINRKREAVEKLADTEKKIEDIEERSVKRGLILTDAIIRRNNAREALARSRADEGHFGSAAEALGIAEPTGGFTPTQRANLRGAALIEELKAQQRYLVLDNREALARKRGDQIRALASQSRYLTEAARDPEKALREAAEGTQEVLNKFDREGIPVRSGD